MAETKWKIFYSDSDVSKDKVFEAQLDGVALIKVPRRR